MLSLCTLQILEYLSVPNFITKHKHVQNCTNTNAILYVFVFCYKVRYSGVLLGMN